ncbi:MAG: DNA repair protein RecN [Polyangiaceae bacterium]|nr:DNA repair protein RecN [Polyangiaceae bacterium]
MLVALRVQNFVLIEALELRLEPGNNVLTGETGAGKSIVIGALSLVLGGRASSDAVRPGASEAEVEALFDVSGSESLQAELSARGIATDGELVVRRVVQQNGRSRAYLNGRLCAVGELAELAPELADIVSQHESVALADARRHIDYLDRYARLTAERAALGLCVGELHAVLDELDAVLAMERGRAEREAFLRYQLDAIGAVAPEPGELEALGTERSRLKHAELLCRITSAAADRLDHAELALCDELGRLASELGKAADLDPTLAEPARRLEESWLGLRELARELAHYAERLEVDPARLEEVQERMYRLEALLRQHGPRVEDVLAARARLAGELDALAGARSRIPDLERRRDELYAVAAERARSLSAARRRAATDLGAVITAELAALGMGTARVNVEVVPVAAGARHTPAREALAGGATGGGAPTERGELAVDGARLGRDGIDQVQFLIAPNKGSPPRPLGKIASGGELSRALLAIKRALGGYDCAVEPGAARRAIGVQVFDEIDTGVGGATADRIGRSIADIARHRQVLCITHLAPIAAYADAHFVVQKHDADDGTTSAITRVEGKARVGELARMLAGDKASTATERAARELLQAVRASAPA